MYRQLQEKVKEYVIAHLCQLSDKWKFDIDSTNINEPIIVGYGPDDLIFRTPIEQFHSYAVPELIAGIERLCNTSNQTAKYWGGCYMIRRLVGNVFDIYRINLLPNSRNDFCLKLMSKNMEVTLSTKIFGISRSSSSIQFISPLADQEFDKYYKNGELVAPILLLLDPITYFRKYSIIINKEPEFVKNHTVGIYELLLEYFPEMNEELFVKYWALKYLFEEVCADIIFLVGVILTDLYSKN